MQLSSHDLDEPGLYEKLKAHSQDAGKQITVVVLQNAESYGRAVSELESVIDQCYSKPPVIIIESGIEAASSASVRSIAGKKWREGLVGRIKAHVWFRPT